MLVLESEHFSVWNQNCLQVRVCLELRIVFSSINMVSNCKPLHSLFPLLLFIQLLVMGIFIPRCLSNQNTQQSEHVDLTVSIQLRPFIEWVESQVDSDFCSVIVFWCFVKLLIHVTCCKDRKYKKNSFNKRCLKDELAFFFWFLNSKFQAFNFMHSTLHFPDGGNPFLLGFYSLLKW